MKNFYILFVEDDQVYSEQLIILLRRNASDFAGLGAELVITSVRHQQEAEEAVRNAPEFGFDLILLDLSYPQSGTDPHEDFYGLSWLPDLRRSQPDAAIVVMTSYGHERFLLRTVKALRDGKADEFIPKDAPWREVCPRIKEAICSASQRRARRQAALAATRPMRSQVARPVAEDILALARNSRSHLIEVCEDLESGDPSKVPDAPATIRRVIDALDYKVNSIATKLAGPQMEEPGPVHCGKLARDLGDLFRLQLREQAGEVDTVPEGDNLTVLTYEDDLTVALKEVLQNAVFAARCGSARPPSIRLHVLRIGDLVKMTISDSGSGFVPAAIDHMFEQDNSHWPSAEPSQRTGMGLHIARRMMFSLGGDIIAENVDGHARVTLLIRDWVKG
jgi:DNA-binding NarL/FixJ family response regulator